MYSRKIKYLQKNSSSLKKKDLERLSVIWIAMTNLQKIYLH